MTQQSHFWVHTQRKVRAGTLTDIFVGWWLSEAGVRGDVELVFNGYRAADGEDEKILG